MRYTTAQLIARIQETAAGAGIDPAIAVAQLRHESGGFQDRYVYGPGMSRTGAMGVAQFMPGTWARFGQGDPFTPDDALPAWARYMTVLLNKFGGRYDLALAGYNSGENRPEYTNAAAQGRAINWSVLPAGVQNETKPYVENILAAAGRPIQPAAPKKKTPAGSGSTGSKRR